MVFSSLVNRRQEAQINFKYTLKLFYKKEKEFMKHFMTTGHPVQHKHYNIENVTTNLLAGSSQGIKCPDEG